MLCFIQVFGLKYNRALRQYGTDFTIIEKLFPNRTRRQIKNKFKKEEKDNLSKIDFALKNRLPIGTYRPKFLRIQDINEYRALAGVKLKEEKEREQKRREELMQLQSLTKEDEPKAENAGNAKLPF